VIGDLLFQVIFETILELIPKKIRKVAGIILIIIGVLISLIAIPFSLLLMAEDTDFGLLIAALLAIPIVMIFLTGFGLILSTKDDTGYRFSPMDLV
jgi:ABC-type polysaccharide/polyol phosphate export permease